MPKGHSQMNRQNQAIKRNKTNQITLHNTQHRNKRPSNTYTHHKLGIITGAEERYTDPAPNVAYVTEYIPLGTC